MMRLLILICLVCLAPSMSWGLATTMEFGVRGGTDAKLVNENYAITELYYQHKLPWKKEISPGVMTYVRLDSGAGYLEAASNSSGWLSVGGDLVLSLMDGGWEMEVGWRPTLMFDHEFGDDDLGGPVQFSTHVGTTIYLGDAAINYRYQHISNADLYDENPGMDIHMLGVGIRF